MDNEFKIMAKNPKLASLRVQNWIGLYNKTEISSLLELNRGTLRNRLKYHNWKVRELEAITKKLPVI